MAKVRRISLDVKTGKIKKKMVDMIPTPAEPKTAGIKLEDLKKLITYAKSKGWIK